jgi:hypothetical protein
MSAVNNNTAPTPSPRRRPSLRDFADLARLLDVLLRVFGGG